MRKILGAFIVLLIFILIAGFFKMQILYISAINYCKLKPLETTGEALLCHYDFMSIFDKEIAEKYMEIRDYCFLNRDNQYETGVCTDEIMTGKKKYPNPS